MKLLLCLIALCESVRSFTNISIPKQFLLSVGTSAYQIEGAWDEDGKGPSIWDTYTHQHAERIRDGSSGDRSTDSYHLFLTDLEALKELGVDMYRFSISWSRVLPTGFVNKVNQPGLDYYNKVINLLLANHIQPMVTMYHWDLPQPLQDLGGWTNPHIVEHFEDYADLLFKTFGDRVKWWVTINEPSSIAVGYNSSKAFAPGLESNSTWLGYYMATHNLVLAHATAYHLYTDKYRSKQAGKVGASFFGVWSEAKSNSTVDVRAADLANLYYMGMHAQPIYGREGDYPQDIKEVVADVSSKLGFRRSRLPVFTEQQVAYIRGTYDFFGLNYYTSILISANEPRTTCETDWTVSYDPQWPKTADRWLRVSPRGLRRLLNWVKKEYNNPPVFITENGYSGFPEDPSLHDSDRAEFLVTHLFEVLTAMYNDSCNVLGYTHWSLMDNFEWYNGYTEKFGLFYVNFSDPTLRRVPRSSAYVLAEITRKRELLPHYFLDLPQELRHKENETWSNETGHHVNSRAVSAGVSLALLCPLLVRLTIT